MWILSIPKLAEDIPPFCVWGGLTVAGNRAGRVKWRNFSGARIAWEGKETPNIPLFLFLPPIFIAEHLCSLEVSCSSQILAYPQLQWENQKRLWLFKPFCAVSTALVTKAEHQWRKWRESQPNPVVCHSFWWWQPVPAVYLWFMLVFPQGAVCISVLWSKYWPLCNSSSCRGLVLQLARSWFMKNVVLCLCSWVLAVTFCLINFVTRCWQKALFGPRLSVTKAVWILCRSFLEQGHFSVPVVITGRLKFELNWRFKASSVQFLCPLQLLGPAILTHNEPKI